MIIQYPEILLPKPQYKLIESDKILEENLLRKTNSKTLINPSTQLLKDEVIVDQSKNLVDYSTNLLGHYKVEHLGITIVGEKREYFNFNWDFGSIPVVPNRDEDFINEQDFGFFVLPVKAVNGIKIPFKKGDDSEHLSESRVCHCPTNSNYWHFEIRWFTRTNSKEDWMELPKASKKTWQKSVLGTIKSKIREAILLDEPPNSPLSEKDFIKS
mgnify:FL=1